jgi:hypothetical protein
MGFALRIKIGNIQFKGQRAKGKVLLIVGKLKLEIGNRK